MEEGLSAQFIKHATDRSNFTEMPGADGHARITGPCGDTVEIWLRVKNDVISRATYVTDGCDNSRAATGMAIELATGKTVAEARQVSTSDIIAALGGLKKEHCAELAARTLKTAVADYLEMERHPWKKMYR